MRDKEEESTYREEARNLATVLYVMLLGETHFHKQLSILRVPGGWLFRAIGGTPCFVPYSDEFRESIPIETVRIEEEQIVRIKVDDS